MEAEEISPSSIGTETVVIPLFLRMPVRPTQFSYPIEAGVLFTLRVTPAAIKEQWITHSEDMAKAINALPRGWPAVSAGEDKSRPLTAVVFQYYLPLSVLNNFTDSHGLTRVSPVEDQPLFVCQTFLRLAQLIIPSLSSTYPFSTSFMDQFVLLFCAHVAHHRSVDQTERIVHRGGLSTWQKKRTVEILSSGEFEDVRLLRLAKECGVSTSHFSRAFKFSFGMPVHRWIVTQRIEKAKHLLTHSEAPLLAVAQETGFTDQASFNRTFAKMTGISPGRWRRYFRL